MRIDEKRFMITSLMLAVARGLPQDRPMCDPSGMELNSSSV